MKRLLATLPLLAIAGVTPAVAQLVTVKQLSRDIVLKMLTTAVTCAQTDKVTVAIVDANQLVLAEFRGPGGTVGALEVARRKADTATQFGQPTSVMAARMAANPAQAAVFASAGDLLLGGAVPIKVGDEVLGAIGVSGGPQIEDKCANAAIAAVQDQLR